MKNQETYHWAHARTTILGSKLAMVGGILATLFGFVLFDSGQATLIALANAGIAAASVLFIIGLLVLRAGATPKASAGFVAFAISTAALTIASAAVDSLAASGGSWAALDILLILVGSVAALAGGLFLVASLASLTTGTVLGRAAGYIFVVGGILQMVAGAPDAAGMAMNSTYLQNVTSAFYGIAGLLFTVLGPILLYVAVRKLSGGKVDVEKKGIAASGQLSKQVLPRKNLPFPHPHR
ncbi:MAG: hypothetical protein JRN67_00640 [Nitrososphaerota archaeon]|jgi:MFS family permease|nr:hypothetical protein [Nitrososphaerota archaeon]